jgi:hypothetical protein
VSKIVSILEELGHWCDWRTCHSRRGILDASRKFQSKILGCTRLVICATGELVAADVASCSGLIVTMMVAQFGTVGFECECLLILADVELDDPSYNIDHGSSST